MKAAYCPVVKNNFKGWSCAEVGHYAN